MNKPKATKIQAGMINGFPTVATDVSARKQAEGASRANDEKFRVIVENAGDYALIMLDAGGHVISWNIGAERLNSYKAAEIIGKHFSFFVRPKTLRGSTRTRNRLLQPDWGVMQKKAGGSAKMAHAILPIW